MTDRCAACGRPITTVRASNRIITLEQVWTHYSRHANRNHVAIPEKMVNRVDRPATPQTGTAEDGSDWTRLTPDQQQLWRDTYNRLVGDGYGNQTAEREAWIKVARQNLPTYTPKPPPGSADQADHRYSATNRFGFTRHFDDETEANSYAGRDGRVEVSPGRDRSTG